MLLLGGMSAMMSMGMAMSDVMSRPPDAAMREPMMRSIRRFMTGYIPFVLLPALVVLGGTWLDAARNYPRLANAGWHWTLEPTPGGILKISDRPNWADTRGVMHERTERMDAADWRDDV